MDVFERDQVPESIPTKSSFDQYGDVFSPDKNIKTVVPRKTILIPRRSRKTASFIGIIREISDKFGKYSSFYFIITILLFVMLGFVVFKIIKMNL